MLFILVYIVRVNMWTIKSKIVFNNLNIVLQFNTIERVLFSHFDWEKGGELAKLWSLCLSYQEPSLGVYAFYSDSGNFGFWLITVLSQY